MNNNILIVHHNDADGHCAAAIVRYELTNPMNLVDYYEYNYSGNVEAEIKSGATVYLVDISMSIFVEQFIQNCLKEACKVIHIDHHKPSVQYYNDNTVEDPNWIYFVHDENDEKNGAISGALLTFIYTCMKEDKRNKPMDVDFDLTELRDHLIFDGDMENEYRVPMLIRMIDDHDVWRHNLVESKPFSYAYKRMPADMVDPAEDDLWEAIYNDNHHLLFNSIQSGERYVQDENERNESLRNIGGFITAKFNNNCYCLNNLFAGSDQFGDMYEDCDMVCRFAYNGKAWKYSLYSSNPEIDCSDIAKRYGGGGHKGAAGFDLPYCIFGGEPPKLTLKEKIKKLFKK